jgi:predicted dehydrogenase
MRDQLTMSRCVRFRLRGGNSVKGREAMGDQCRKRYAQVGLGGRSDMYTDALTRMFKDQFELVGFCDPNQTRMDFANEMVERNTGKRVPTYKAEDFNRMVKECKADGVIVTTKDCFHDVYIVRAMELGCDVITEKPMTTDAQKCQSILDTQKRTGKKVTVTFNYRYSPIRSKLREVVQSGVIGDVRSVDFNWMLDVRHGADYFRRWHSNKVNSGGLLVHKATHHFDLVNWWIASHPVTVYAMGARTYALPKTAKALGLENHGERCHTCPVTYRCPYYLDLRRSQGLSRLYLQAEHEDGYYRDRCVFAEDIDIEDQMSLTVRYENGAQMAYSLHSFLPWEGYRIAINGTLGRIEHEIRESSYISGDGTIQGAFAKEFSLLRVFPMHGKPYDVDFMDGVGGHGGGDERLLHDVFGCRTEKDPLGHAATHVDGAYSILTGIAANESIRTGQAVEIGSLVRFP